MRASLAGVLIGLPLALAAACSSSNNTNTRPAFDPGTPPPPPPLPTRAGTPGVIRLTPVVPSPTPVR